MYRMYCMYRRVREDSAAAFMVVNAAFFTGLFTFAVFLGIVSDEVKSTFRDIRMGAYPLRMADHVLVLNWSHHTIPLLRQYALARKHCASHGSFFRRKLVLLSDVPKQAGFFGGWKRACRARHTSHGRRRAQWVGLCATRGSYAHSQQLSEPECVIRGSRHCHRVDVDVGDVA